MTQSELDIEVARATGESIARIQRHGFSSYNPEIRLEERLQPLILDWDAECNIRYLLSIA